MAETSGRSTPSRPISPASLAADRDHHALRPCPREWRVRENFSRTSRAFVTPARWKPRIVEAARSMRAKSVTGDGEGGGLRPTGVTDFDRLRAILAMGGPPQGPQPVLWKARPGIRRSDHIESGYGQAMFEAACTMGLEGILSKRTAHTGRDDRLTGSRSRTQRRRQRPEPSKHEMSGMCSSQR
jgi:hypothetical protein